MRSKYCSFDELVHEKDYLIKSCMKRLNIYRDQEDFYQVGLIALYKAFMAYDERKDKNKNFDVYAYYIILNYMKNELTRQNRNVQHEVTCSEDYWIHIQEPKKLESVVTNNILYESFMKRLSKEDQKIFNLKRLGFANAEIAGILGIKFERVKYRLKCIYKLIREQYDQFQTIIHE